METPTYSSQKKKNWNVSSISINPILDQIVTHINTKTDPLFTDDGVSWNLLYDISCHPCVIFRLQSNSCSFSALPPPPLSPNSLLSTKQHSHVSEFSNLLSSILSQQSIIALTIYLYAVVWSCSNQIFNSTVIQKSEDTHLIYITPCI